MKTLLLFISVLFLCVNTGNAQFSHWPLQTNLEDVINFNNGTPQGTVNFVDDPVMGNVMQLTGDGYVELPPDMFGDVSDVTITCWFNYAGVSAWERVYSFGYSNRTETEGPTVVQTIYLVPRDGDGKLHVTYQATGPWYDMVGTNPTDSIIPDTWYFSAFEKKADTIRFYLNGELVPGFERVAVAEEPSMLNDSMNWLGRSHWVDPLFTGMITDLRIYKSALTPAEIKALYTPVTGIKEKATPSEPLVYSTGGRIYIKVNEAGTSANSSVEVFDILGKEVFKSGNLTSISNKEFKNGIYLVKVTYANKAFVKKIVISH